MTDLQNKIMSIVQNKKDYYEYTKEYNRLHATCPICGSKDYISTLLSFTYSNSIEYKNMNECICNKCGYKHIVNDRVA